MNSLLQHAPRDYFPRHLTPEEIENPQLVLQKFYDTFPVDKARHLLNEMLRHALNTRNLSTDITETSHLLFFGVQFQRLTEAGYLLDLYSRLAGKENDGPRL